MTKNLTYIGIIVLLIIAIVLGYQIYQQQTGYDTSSQNQSINNQEFVTPQAITPNSTATAPLTNQPSAEEIAVLNFPGPNATDAEKKAHSNLVNEVGNKVAGTPFLDISGCKPNPIVYRVKRGATFNIKNSDAIDHTINTERKAIIKSNSEQTLASKGIGDDLGNYAYSCDDSAGPVGVIQIIPN
jgi:hypothetical protein